MGTSTRSKDWRHWPEGAPGFVQSAQGATVTDVDGRQWLDWTMSLGPMLLGYGDPVVQLAVMDQLNEAILLPLPHQLEVEVAERICDLCPGVEAVRFGKTGSDAVAAAVRAARIYTGRQTVVTDGAYHGWHDWCSTGEGLIPQQTGLFRGHGDLYDAAALVICPDRFSSTELEILKARCKAAGALLIFDEVITGFRMAPGGAREYYGVHPDLSCYGKALANGLPLSAVGGGWDVMSVFNLGFWSGTHHGECLSLAAAKAVLDRLADGQILREIAERGRRLWSALPFLEGYPQHLQHLRWPFEGPEDETLVRKIFLEEGILFNGHFFGCAAHTDEDIDRTIKAGKRLVW